MENAQSSGKVQWVESAELKVEIKKLRKSLEMTDNHLLEPLRSARISGLHKEIEKYPALHNILKILFLPDEESKSGSSCTSLSAKHQLPKIK